MTTISTSTPLTTLTPTLVTTLSSSTPSQVTSILTAISNDMHTMNGTILPYDIIDIIVTYTQRWSRVVMVGWKSLVVKIQPTFVMISIPTSVPLSAARIPKAAIACALVPEVQSIPQPTLFSFDPRFMWEDGASGIIGDYMYCTYERRLGRYHIDTSEPRFDLEYMHTSRYRPASQVINDRFYVVGGASDASDDSSSCEWYDPYMNRWSHAPSLTTARHSGAAIELNQRIFVAGGSETRSLDDRAMQSGCEAYDPRCDTTWHTLSPMIQPRLSFGFVSLSSYTALAIGGISKQELRSQHDHSYFRSILEYDSRHDAWMESTIYPVLPRSAMGVGSAALINNTLIWLPYLYDRDRSASFAYYLPLHASTMRPLAKRWRMLPPHDHVAITTYISAI